MLELEQLQRQVPQLEQATHSLEDMVGISDPQALTPQGPQGGASSPRNAALPLPERLEQAVAAASTVAAELQSMHRQLVTSGLLLQQEEARAAQLQADVVQARVGL